MAAPRPRVVAAVSPLSGIHPIREALRARRRVLHRLRLRGGSPSSGPVAELIALAEAAGVPVEALEVQAFDALIAPGLQTQGVLLEAGSLPELDLEAVAKGSGASPRTLVALDGVEDPQNLGAIARVAEAVGASGLLMTQRRSAPLSPAASRASAGALEWLPVARVVNLRRALNQLKSMGFWVFGAETVGGQDAFSIPQRWAAGDRIVVFGSEGRGLRPGVAAALDHRLTIPLSGEVDSLNVAAAAAIVLFELRRWDGTGPKPQAHLPNQPIA